MNETDHEPNAVKVDDLIIDEDTGEILEMPKGVSGELVEFLTFREGELARGESAYKQARFLIKLAIKRELEKLDLKSLQTQHGRPVIRSRTTRKGVVERIHHVVVEYELGSEQVIDIFACASALDPKKLESSLPPEVAEALIEEKTSEWLQVSPVLKEPPVVEKI